MHGIFEYTHTGYNKACWLNHSDFETQYTFLIVPFLVRAAKYSILTVSAKRAPFLRSGGAMKVIKDTYSRDAHFVPGMTGARCPDQGYWIGQVLPKAERNVFLMSAETKTGTGGLLTLACLALILRSCHFMKDGPAETAGTSRTIKMDVSLKLASHFWFQFRRELESGTFLVRCSRSLLFSLSKSTMRTILQ